jgi:tetratricopeptide (TPR) repeat protein
MKAEHRKELQTNVLADTLGRVLVNVKKGPSRQTLIIVGVVVVIVLGYLGWRYLSRSSQESRSALWVQVDQENRQLDAAADLGQVEVALTQLEEAAKEHAGTVPAQVMRLIRARTLLYLGLENLCAQRERDKAIKQVEEARDLYAQLAEQTSKTPVLHQETLLGVARAKESLGQVDEAREDYRNLANRYPQSAAGKLAQQRLEYLEKNGEQVQDLYKALDKMAGARAKP